MNDPHAVRPPRGGSGAAGAILILLAALGAYGWVLALPFQLDDYSQIPAAGHTFGLEERMEKPAAAAASAGEGTVAITPYLFRPALWLLWVGETRISPRPLAPWIFHAGNLVLHAVAALLVVLLLRRLLGAGPAVIGALFFALHPAGAEATSWIAAGGDLLATVFGLLAALILVGRPATALRAAAAGGALALAFLAKPEPAVALLGLFGVGIGLRPRSGGVGQRFLHVGLVLLPAALGYAWRAMTLGTLALGYAGGTQVTLDALPHMAGKLPDHLRFLAAPYLAAYQESFPPVALEAARRVLPEAGFAAWTAIAALFLLWPLAGFLHGPGRFVRVALPAAVILAVLIIPPLFAAPETAGAVFSRSLYLLMVPLAAIVAAAAAALRGGGARASRRRMAVLAVVAVLQMLLSADALVHTARAHLAAGEGIEERLEGVERVLAREAAGTGIAFVDPTHDEGPIPGLGPLIEAAFRRPFRAVSADVMYFPSRESLLRHSVLGQWPRPLRILEATGRGRQEPGPLLPALPQGAVVLVPVVAMSAPDLRVFRPAQPVPPRAVAALAVRLPAGVHGPFALSLATEATQLEKQAVLSETRSERRLTVVMDAGWEWTTSSDLREVTARAAGLESMPAPELLREAPTLDLRRPKRGDRLRLGDLPVVDSVGAPAEASLRVEFDIWLDGQWLQAMVYGPLRARLKRTETGGCLWTPALEDPVSSPLHGALRWETVPQLFDTYLASRGVREVPWRVRVHAVTDDGGLTMARSPWAVFYMVK